MSFDPCTMSYQSHVEHFEKIKTLIFPSSVDACSELAQQIKGLILARQKEGRDLVLGLATGSTPVPLYRELIRIHREEKVSFRNVITFNLDEYYGINRDHPESYFRFMQDQLFDHVDIPPDHIHVPDGMVPMDDAFDSCEAFERKIADAGGIDLQILGIGSTGHIGFNEPGSTQVSRTRLVALDKVTRRDAAPDFLGEENVPRFAITMGVGTILQAREIILMAWGENKADIVAQAVEGHVTESISASFLQEHSNVRFLLDTAASSSLTRIRLPWLVGRAMWDEREIHRSIIWLAGKEKKPVLKLTDEEYNENGMGDLLTREGSAYNLNIITFNRLQHTITGWPGGKPDADDTNRPEKSEPHPKNVLIIAPEPSDAVVSMAGTMSRLVTQGHRVRVCYFTSGSLRVTDGAATRFARTLEMLSLDGEKLHGGGRDETVDRGWSEQRSFASLILNQILEKGPFGEHPAALRRLKALIRRGEARDACSVVGVHHEHIRFLDLPFYEKGRYRRFIATEEDLMMVADMLAEERPDQVYTTGSQADPSSIQAICFQLFIKALKRHENESWAKMCSIWHYRGHQKALAPHEIAMAVPMSPDQLRQKISSIGKFQVHGIPNNLSGEQDLRTAVDYDALGMAEYEAIESFERIEGLKYKR